jgi:choloylglycine hydrolase
VFGRNLDYLVGDGLVIINKRGVKKTARSSPYETSNRLTWTSKYGSTTFNQDGREFPLGGMNEAGLVLETMILEETEYPAPDSRPGIGILQWVQYQLDNFSTIEEVIAGQSQIRISKTEAPGLHVLVCDRTGNCATIEFLGKKLVYHHKERMPVKTLTNSTYAESISFWKKNKIPQPDKYKSVERFIRAANMVKNYDPKTTKTPIDFAFDILESVAHDSYTQWRIVYDVKNLSVYFRTLENQTKSYFSLQSFNFSCATPVKVLDVNTELSGDITDKFVDYTYQINRNLIGEAYRKIDSASHLSDHILDMQANYPELTSCAE